MGLEAFTLFSLSLAAGHRIFRTRGPPKLVNLRLGSFDRFRCDALPDPVRRTFLAALAEAREALAAGRVPAGAEPFVKWWRGDSQYEGGRCAAPAGLWTSRLPDDALRCVCEHLAPTSPLNFEAEDIVDESQEYCEEVVCDLRTLGEEELDDIASRLDDYKASLSYQTGNEASRAGVAGGLKLVCGRWRHALKK